MQASSLVVAPSPSQASGSSPAVDRVDMTTTMTTTKTMRTTVNQSRRKLSISTASAIATQSTADDPATRLLQRSAPPRHPSTFSKSIPFTRTRTAPQLPRSNLPPPTPPPLPAKPTPQMPSTPSSKTPGPTPKTATQQAPSPPSADTRPRPYSPAKPHRHPSP